MIETTRAELVRDLLAMGVRGRHVMAHSSYSLLKPVEGGPQGVVDALVEAVGDDGCLLLPTYDFESFTERGYWDRNESPSRMGVISETARKDVRFQRTDHPILSYAIYVDPDTRPLGYGCPLYDESGVSHGASSVFENFVEYGGLLISIGADKQKGFRPNDTGFTISNHAAVLAGAPWRKMKVFEGVYVDGDTSIRKYAASVNADPSRYVTEVTPGHIKAEREGIIKRMPLGRTECWVADAAEFVEWAIQSHKDSPELWRKVIPDEPYFRKGARG